MAEARVFQIYYDAATRHAVDPDFEPLDNSASARPDWYEYWPIRQFLEREALREDTLYGFVSPLFRVKTRLTGRQVHEFARAAGDVDVVTFSPHPHYNACSINVFEQCEQNFPGTLQAARRFLHDIAPGFVLETFVTHSRNTVFSNFFLARPSFWRRWSEVCALLFAAAEPPPTPLLQLLTQTYLYSKEGSSLEKLVQAKVFVMERLVSFLLQHDRVSVANYPPFSMPLSVHFVGWMPQLVELDRLKLAFCDSGDPRHLHAYAALREKTLRAVYGATAT
ncbi:MAG: hypothetical protein ACREVQ_11665 [Burkholderiales bacterium]